MTTIRSSSGNEPRNGPQKDRFSRARSARNDDVLPQADADLDEFLGRRAEAAEGDQVVDREDLLGESADREVNARPRTGGNDRMDAGAIGQPGVQDRPLVGDFAADPLGDVVDRRQQGIFAGKAGVGADQLARGARCRCNHGR